jgi:hypothetical protein
VDTKKQHFEVRDTKRMSARVGGITSAGLGLISNNGGIGIKAGSLKPDQ